MSAHGPQHATPEQRRESNSTCLSTRHAAPSTRSSGSARATSATRSNTSQGWSTARTPTARRSGHSDRDEAPTAAPGCARTRAVPVKTLGAALGPPEPAAWLYLACDTQLPKGRVA